MTPHQALRQATSAAHDRVDASFAALDLADPKDYAAFLTRHAAAFIPIEQALTAAGAADHVADWEQLSRAELLAADLAELGIDLPPPVDPPAFTTPAAILGGAYVLQGSRLGGAMLRRSVAEGQPRRFLDSIQPQGRWRRFTALLDQQLSTPTDVARATESALQTFALFEGRERNIS